MIHGLVATALGITLGASFLLLAFGANLLYLSLRSLMVRPAAPPIVAAGEEPAVCVQLPVYNERYVASRVIDAACGLDWPANRLTVQVLDDSTDATVEIVGRRVAHWARRGVAVTHVRRLERTGYKAGALAEGMERTRAELIAVFDADFVPPPDFLRRTVGAFADPGVGFVQARWGHLNSGYSWITKLQAHSIDFHFLVEQAVRVGGGYFTNFAGTAGVWRRAAVLAAGGWKADTLTEDFDLSYRAQLAGWRAVYLEDVVVPEELPVSVVAFRRQQSRWATGIFQCAFRLGPRVLWADVRPAVKWQAAIHMSSYAAPILMLAQLLCFPLLLYGRHVQDPSLVGSPWLALVNLLSLAPVSAFVAAQVRRRQSWWLGLAGVVCQILGAGLALTCVAALTRAVRPGGEFKRTPKFSIEQPDEEWRDRSYVVAADIAAIVELVAAAFGAAVVAFALGTGEWLIALYAGLMTAGFLILGIGSSVQALEVLALRHLGRRALLTVRGAVPFALLLAPPLLLLTAFVQLPDPFEDSFQHWLIAANLLQNGRLADPLFGMEDTWLPAYHVFGAAVLAVSGWHNLPALRVASAGLGLATLVLVERLGGRSAIGRTAVLLIALNPVFLLTATSAVAEPLLVVALLGASAAALKGRLRLAALLAAFACLTGTKAWLWVLAVAGVYLLEGVGKRRLPRPAIAWLAPALLVLAIVEAAGAPALHSVARAAGEVSSATARGSLVAAPLGRGGEFVWFMGIGLAPLLLLAPLGALAERRTADGRARIRLLHLPAAIYLVAVVILVTAGVYTGSDRYLYPALPSLGILAAAAVQAYAPPLRLALIGAATLLAIAFVPVVAGFSAANRGLLAAGAATRGYPGPLLTDSPAAAYASGRPPAELIGSRGLPAGYEPAVEWLRGHRVSTVVLEDIDYYRATSVLAGPSRGVATPPFQELGEQGSYNPPGGKHTYAFRLPPQRFCAWLGPVALIDVDPAHQPATGKSARLEKGAILENAAGAGLAGEGVGFGVPLVRYPDGDFFAGDAQTTDLSVAGAPAWRKVFDLDLSGADDDRAFVAAPSRGRIEVTYRVVGPALQVSVRALDLAPGYTSIVVLNEQSATFDDLADAGTTRLGAAIGSWSPVQGDWARFRSGGYGLEWSLPAVAGAELVGAREIRAPDIDFSGLEYVFDTDFLGADYSVSVQKAR